MSTATTEPRRQRRPKPRSAYRRSLPELLDAARKLVDERGEVPSQNELTRLLHIGAPKAREVHAALLRPDLHVVPDAATEPDPEPATNEPDTVDELDAEPDGTTAGTTTEPDPTDPSALTDDEPPPQEDTNTAPEPSTAPGPVSSTAEPHEVPDEPAHKRRTVSVLPVMALTLPALVAVWSGWVSLGAMAGFGVVHPLPGIADHLTLNTAITLPIGVEVYAAYALYVWLTVGIPARARKFAKVSAIASLITGAAGQVTYHLLSAAHFTHAPWPVTMLVACLPVAVLGMGAALAHLVRSE
ncbi:ABC transporter permease [Actinocatenispora thailandica]|uniref:ABC transporter permease n=1 Tax=Actinocatenispora thailandica TaxID=227318 RepID=A0A7R7HZJ7_9ACTN|nr:ABC transporter permease [Actinocatenispora thailandica]BCJ37581.1 ABC transporter permease [Actinocatenispora thailandica]